MKIAIVNNGIHFPEKIAAMVCDYTYTVFNRKDISALNHEDFDLIILSGSSQLPVKYSQEILEPEMELIRTSTTPVLGICYGCELMAVAFGGQLTDAGADSKKRSPISIHTTQESALFLEKKHFLVYDAHRWIIERVPKEFDILATSDHGPEIIKHKTRPLYGFQFHPEKMHEQTDGYILFHNLLKTLSTDSR